MEDTKRNQQMNSQDDTQKYLDCFIYMFNFDMKKLQNYDTKI